MVEIIPAILSKSAEDYYRKMKSIEPFTEWVQVDIVDNKFARNQTIDAHVVTSFQTTKKLEIQLMVDFIEDWIDPFVEAKVSRIIVPQETARDPVALINHLRSHGIPIGFSLNPETPVSSLQHVIDKLDTVLLLAVHPGFSGQHFVYSTLEKIRHLREMRPDITIEIDGGIEPGTARKCAEVGANILVAGSFLFDHGDRKGASRSVSDSAKIEGESISYQDTVKAALDLLKADVEGIAPVLEG